MSSLLPLFPLSLVPIPGEVINLHIFEERYRQLVKDCVEEDLSFGIPVFEEGKVLTIGAEMKVEAVVKKYVDGKMDISTRALRPFKLLEFNPNFPDKLYPGGSVEFLDWDEDGDVMLSAEIIKLAGHLYEVMNINNVPLQDLSSFKTYQIAHKVGFNKEQEIEFLKVSKEVDRQYYMLEHLKAFLPMVIEMEELRKKAALNGHFKNIIPPKF